MSCAVLVGVVTVRTEVVVATLGTLPAVTGDGGSTAGAAGDLRVLHPCMGDRGCRVQGGG